MDKIRKFLLGSALALVVVTLFFGGAIADRLFVIKPLNIFFPPHNVEQKIVEKTVVEKEESVIINIAERVSPSVVTVSVVTPKRRVIEFGPFGDIGVQERGGQQDIATGFIVNKDGLIVTNKHVVANQGVKYKVITKDDKEYEVKNIYRDPANDLALLKIDPAGSNLKPVELGDSSHLRVGQLVVAIGTALGEFRHTVTTGVISGLGRGIVAGSVFEGYVERLDNVIQTDAAINPGNSGGPLLDSSGRVIGVNVAVAAGAENIGFAIPVNVLKESIQQFEQTGEFIRPFLGVQYQMISRAAAIANEIPEGAYVRDVIPGSSAEQAGIQPGDIITKFGGERVTEKDTLAKLVNKHKVGDSVEIEIWRDERSLTLTAVLQKAENP